MALNFSFYPDRGETPATLLERRRREDELAGDMGRGNTYGSGIGDLFRGLGVGLSRYRTNKMQKKGEAGARSGMDRLMSIMYGNPANQNADYTAGQPGDVLAQASKSIAGIESGGDYSALGPTTRTGDRAYGKYQVMGANIPEWTEAATGQRLTPEEFLAMPGAQEKVFQHQFGGYLKEHSPEDAASMWFTGKPLAEGAGLTDQLGTSGQGYADQFNAGMGGGNGMPMVPQLATYTPPQPQPAGGPIAPQMPPQVPPAPQGPAPMAPAPVADMAPMQPASADSAMIPQIMEMLRNPFVSDQDKAFLQQRLEDIQKKQDPMYKMGLEKSRIELDRLRDPSKTPLDPLQKSQLEMQQAQLRKLNLPPDAQTWQDPNTGDLYAYDPRDPQNTMKLVQKAGAKPSENFRQLSAEEATKLGLAPGNYQIGPDNKITEIGGALVKIDNKGLTAEEEAAGKPRGERMDALESGVSIKSLQQIQLASRLLENVDTNALAGMKGSVGNMLAAVGVPVENLSAIGIDPNIVTTGPEIQSLVNRGVISMIGSGQFPAQNFSDTDRIFLEKIFPSLTNLPQANKLIGATAGRLYEIENQKRAAWAVARKSNQTFRDFEIDWNDKLAKRDIFGDIAAMAKQAGGGDPMSTSSEKVDSLVEKHRTK